MCDVETPVLVLLTEEAAEWHLMGVSCPRCFSWEITDGRCVILALWRSFVMIRDIKVISGHSGTRGSECPHPPVESKVLELSLARGC